MYSWVTYFPQILHGNSSKRSAELTDRVGGVGVGVGVDRRSRLLLLGPPWILIWPLRAARELKLCKLEWWSIEDIFNIGRLKVICFYFNTLDFRACGLAVIGFFYLFIFQFSLESSVSVTISCKYITDLRRFFMFFFKISVVFLFILNFIFLFSNIFPSFQSVTKYGEKISLLIKAPYNVGNINQLAIIYYCWWNFGHGSSLC